MTTVIKGSSNINLDFSTGGRITGDFSNSTLANRVYFQNATAGQTTSLGVLPGSGFGIAAINVFSQSDPANSSLLQHRIESGADARISSSITGTGTYLPMTFYTGGSERVRIDTSGNVGIGTSSPGAKLDVAGGGIISTGYNSRGSGGEGGEISLNNPGDASIGAYFDVAGADQARWFSIRNNCSFSIGQLGGTGGVVAFFTGAAERARITSGGDLVIGATSSLAKLDVRQASNSTGAFLYKSDTGTASAVIVRHEGATGSTSRTQIEFLAAGGTTVGSISSNGTTTGYNTSSDYRLKNSIAPMTDALAKVALLKPCTYKWNADNSDGEGFIAHELAEVCPQAVTGEKDAVDVNGKPIYQGIDTSFLVATLTAAIQELKAELDTVKAELATLKGAA